VFPCNGVCPDYVSACDADNVGLIVCVLVDPGVWSACDDEHVGQKPCP
jgi:hypothetical protein